MEPIAGVLAATEDPDTAQVIGIWISSPTRRWPLSRSVAPNRKSKIGCGSTSCNPG